MIIETKQSTMSRQITQLSGETQIQVRGMKSDGRTTHIKSELSKCQMSQQSWAAARVAAVWKRREQGYLPPGARIICYTLFCYNFHFFFKVTTSKKGKTILFPEETGISPSWRYSRLSKLCFCL